MRQVILGRHVGLELLALARVFQVIEALGFQVELVNRVAPILHVVRNPLGVSVTEEVAQAVAADLRGAALGYVPGLAVLLVPADVADDEGVLAVALGLAVVAGGIARAVLVQAHRLVAAGHTPDHVQFVKVLQGGDELPPGELRFLAFQDDVVPAVEVALSGLDFDVLLAHAPESRRVDPELLGSLDELLHPAVALGKLVVAQPVHRPADLLLSGSQPLAHRFKRAQVLVVDLSPVVDTAL